MENQHRRIKGYRELNETEIALMNSIKEKSQELAELISKVNAHLTAQNDAVQQCSCKDETGPWSQECDRLEAAEPFTWMQQGKMHLQEGMMCLTRAVAQPTFF
jgi:SH3-like domain-containing protein